MKSTGYKLLFQLLRRVKEFTLFSFLFLMVLSLISKTHAQFDYGTDLVVGESQDYYQLTDQQITEAPMREVSIIVTKEGFYPKNIALFEGEKVRFFVTSTIERPGCFTLPTHKLFMAANQGSITEGIAEFDETGKFEFYCPSDKSLRGEITVLKRQKHASRKIASEPVQRIWMPREK